METTTVGGVVVQVLHWKHAPGRDGGRFHEGLMQSTEPSLQAPPFRGQYLFFSQTHPLISWLLGMNFSMWVQCIDMVPDSR